ncbi:MAG: ATP:cob(I)alamin adenosyltransferase [Erysipelotrichaceae bacterium]
MNDVNACAYPFLKETSKKCDFEIETDLLASMLGSASAMANGVLQADCDRLCLDIYHLNGSIRGRVAIQKVDVDWIMERYAWYEQALGPVRAFVVPKGCLLAGQLHTARCVAKKVTRLAYQIEAVQHVDEHVITYANMSANLLFYMALYANKEANVAEVVFVSKSYGNPQAD